MNLYSETQIKNMFSTFTVWERFRILGDLHKAVGKHHRYFPKRLQRTYGS